MIIFISLMLFPAFVGLLVTWLLHRDNLEERRIHRLEKDTPRFYRFFAVKKRMRILCADHGRKTLRRGEIALIDPRRCVLCLDGRNKS